MPRPRKASVAAAKMAYPNRIVPSTRIGAVMFGRISATMIRGPRSPRRRAAATYSRSRSTSTADRTVRAISGVKMMPITRMTFRGSRPSEARTSTARMMSGNARSASTIRLKTSSIQPR
jgi:hypothetical protein